MAENQAHNRSGGMPSAGRELIVIVKPEAGVRATRTGIRSVTGADVTALNDLMASEGVTLKPLPSDAQRLRGHWCLSAVAESGRCGDRSQRVSCTPILPGKAAAIILGHSL